MKERSPIDKFIQSHKALEPFDYQLAVDWAMELLHEGNDSDAVLMLASFTQPIEKHEISKYVTAVLRELGLEELECEEAVLAQTHYLLSKILKGITIRENLKTLFQLYVVYYDSRIIKFYLLYYAWMDLEEIGTNFYYEGAYLNNIETILKLEARIWIDKYIRLTENVALEEELDQIIKESSK
ncbi:hypothetical protein GOQ30_01055 [Flavobacterium sp. TP390]|uniref:Uncharacterized protein n=1 Tax=Flavobacterium profundi TaxID=1774945 RepID=A0A6I4IDW2_9FLAO|nr:hypothetical protein [Flavobacterium profundi]MVO07748.1 hypothetical protein [Flavobacterium profundi]